MLRSAKPRVKIQPPEDLDLLPTTDNNIFTSGAQDNNSDHGSDNTKPEIGPSPTTNNQNMPLPVPSTSPAVCLSYYSLIYLTLCPQSTISPINLIQAYLTQLSGTSTPALPVQVSAILPSHTNQPKKSSKGIKAYPDGWQTVLNTAKDVVHGSVLIKNPFPSPNLTWIAANKGFHEAVAAKCSDNGLILEPGRFSPAASQKKF